jgi:hypothetical protein
LPVILDKQPEKTNLLEITNFTLNTTHIPAATGAAYIPAKTKQ